MLDQDLIDSLLHAADIVTVISHYINVEKKGRNFVAVCPFHNDTNPSLQISAEKQIFKCFACGTGGNAIGFVQEFEKIPFMEAARKVAEIVGFHDPRLEAAAKPKAPIDPEKQRLIDCINDLQSFYRYSLMTPEGEKARGYLANRHLDLAQQQKYAIGYAPLDGARTIQYLEAKGHSRKSIEDIGIAMARTDMNDVNAGRLIFPLADPEGQVIGFSARQLEKNGTSKYVNSPETPLFHKGEVLYNYHNAVKTAHRVGYCYILEGFMDVMALDKAGIGEAVALMGTALTKTQVGLLKRMRCEIRLCLDGDQAGQKGMMAAIRLLTDAKIPYKIVDYGSDLRDPDDILQEDGPEALQKKMTTLVDALDFQLNYYVNFKTVDSAEDKEKVLRHFLPLLASESGIEQENHVAKLSAALNYDPSALRVCIANESKKKQQGIDLQRFEDGMHGETAPHPQRLKRLTNRLGKAEDMILYYLLSDEKARQYIEEMGNPLYTPDYRRLLEAILEYGAMHGAVDPSGLMSYLGQVDEEHQASLSYIVADIATQAKAAPPFSEEIVDRCKATIEVEKAKAIDERKAERAVQSGDREAAARAVKELAEAKKNGWGKKKS